MRRLFLALLLAASLPLAAKVQITDFALPKTVAGKPTDIVAGPDGNMWFIDQLNGSICRIESDGTITDFPGLYADSLTVGADGGIWFTDAARIKRLDPWTGVVDNEIWVPGMSYWSDLASGPDGNLWLVTGCDDKVMRISYAGVIHEFPTTAGGCPYQIIAGPDGNMWFTEHYGERVGRITTGGVLTEFPVTGNGGSSVIYPDDITVGPDGNIWFTSNYGYVTRMTTSGAQTVQHIDNSYFAWITTGSDGNLYVGTNAKIIKFNTNFQVLGTKDLTGDAQIMSLAKGPDGNVWASANGTGVIARLKMDGSLTEFAAITRGGDPGEVVLGPEGNVWFTETEANRIGLVTGGGEFREYAVPTANSRPKGITNGADGALWFVEFAGDKVGRITVDGAISEFPLTPGSGATDIVLGSDGNFWITLKSRDRIARMTPAGVVTEYPLPAGSKPGAIVSGPDGKLWFTEETGYLGRMGTGGDFAELAWGSIPPRDLTVKGGAIWFTDGWYLKRSTLEGNVNQVAQVFNGPQHILAGPGDAIWMTAPGGSSVVRFSPATGPLYYSLPITGGMPHGMAFTADGNLWFAQESASRMSRLSIAFDAYPMDACVTTPTMLQGKLAKFLDLSGVGTPSDYAATINWGDGASQPGTITVEGVWVYVSGSHTYATGGTKSVTVTITDLRETEDTATVTSTFQPKLDATMTITGNYCPGSLMTASVPDAGDGATYEWWHQNLVSVNGRIATFHVPQNAQQSYIEVTIRKTGFCDGNAVRIIQAACGTFNDSDGDGLGDVLWSEAGGQNAMWQMNGFTKQSGSYLPPLAPPWKIVAHADFDGDHKSDIFWRNESTGENRLWIMNGPALLSVKTLEWASLVWKIAGVADFDSNHVADVLWRHSTTGENAMWHFFYGGSKVGQYIESAPLVWSVAGVGDLDGDTRPDIFWRRNDNGENSVWLWDGIKKATGAYVESAPARWQVVAVKDFDADGKADVLWRDPNTGENSMWLMDGLTKRAGAWIESAPKRWAVGPVGDFNGDGRADIFWRDPVTGENAMWLMNGFTKTAGSYLEYASPIWKIFR